MQHAADDEITPLGSAVGEKAVAELRRRAEFGAFADIPDEALGLDDAAFGGEARLRFFVRFGAERAWLRQAGVAPALAEMAAARAAAVFAAGETDVLTPAGQAALPGWIKVMGLEAPPPSDRLAACWPDAPPAAIAAMHKHWARLGTAEALMETGGDIRLARDPRSGLNGYGCSHRARPWAITFASSTASSSSERGYMAADTARLATTVAMLRAGPDGGRAAVKAVLDEVRDQLKQVFGLAPAGAVVLAASGTDTELFALALAHLGAPGAPVLNMLIAPEETGSGVPMAAAGLHFAVDTALGHDVSRATPISGFRPDTRVANIALRDGDGAPRDADAVEAEAEAVLAAAIAERRRPILHVLDLSKTGLLAPRLPWLRKMRTRHGAAFDIVVDACQGRLSGASVRCYLALDAAVLVTGSKFLTGPPFAGAILLPPVLAARLEAGELPSGLDAYFGRDEFPRCAAAKNLPPVGNYGLALRWRAALAEFAALQAVAPPRRAAILLAFGDMARRKIAENPALTLLPAPALARDGAEAEDWERCRSIFGFSMAAPHAPERELTAEEARAVYFWLNADLAAALPELTPQERRIASRICHIGQPVKLPRPGGGAAGVLRVSAGARLISGEPSHGALDGKARIVRELDDLALVFDKIALILEHYEALSANDPAPVYRMRGSGEW